MDRTRPTVLLIGDTQHREFRDAVVWLREHTSLEVAKSIDDAMEGSCDDDGAQPWHTVIFAQARPGQFSAGDVEQVSRRFPLAHYVALLGSLCEGETRSGYPWPGVVRVYWHQFLARCDSELRVSLFPTSWQLPRTASDVERTESVFERSHDRVSGMIVVFTRNASQFDALSAACQTIGYSCVWCSNQRRRNFHGAVAAIWDGETQGQIDFQQLSCITAELPEVPVIALLGFPRHDQVLQAQAHGAQAVVSSPFMLPDLWNAIRVGREGLKG